MDILTVSSCKKWQLCQQKYYWMYEQKIKPVREREAVALSIGRAFHIGMEAQNLTEGLLKLQEYFANGNALLPQQWFKQDAMKVKVSAMLQRAWERWPVPLKLQETVFIREIIDLSDGGISSHFRFGGKVDGLGDGPIVDYKTVTDTTRFLSQAYLDYQLPAYIYGLTALDNIHKVNSLIYRTIEKPTIKRGGITKKRSEPETPRDFESRCYEWLGQPKKLMEEEIFYTEASLKAFINDLWQTTEAILWARENDIWGRNTMACYTWNRECEYLPLCVQLAAGTPLQEVHTDCYEPRTPHSELGKEMG